VVKYSDLKIREIVNVVDGKSLGYIKDIELDLESGSVKALILPPDQSRVKAFFRRSEETVIDWRNIVKVGIDVILVEMQHFTNPNHESGITWIEDI